MVRIIERIPTLVRRRLVRWRTLRMRKSSALLREYRHPHIYIADLNPRLRRFKIQIIYRTYKEKYDDCFINCVDGDCENKEANQYWGYRINFVAAQVGGCQMLVTPSTHVLWAFDAFGTNTFLKLDGPQTADLGQIVTLTEIGRAHV